MLGFRGASRYVSDNTVLNSNAVHLKKFVMKWAYPNHDSIRAYSIWSKTCILAQNGLKRGENGLKVIMNYQLTHC